MTMKKRMVLAAIAVMGAGVASAEVDMRIPKDSYLSAVVDFDAIRQEAPAVVGAVRDGITEGGRTGNIPNAVTALAAMDKCKTWLGEVESGCGLCVSNVHWIVAEAMKREILRLYVQDIGKYAKGYAPKVRAIFRYLPFYMAHCL